ncbi:protein-tyrosine phosphatase family protein [Magnetofaba australis]|uniref:Tyrosine specific protein phosphatases domain-containing protein n=1 Tax=Magnetofaba australis IT-1 TaxID=1434232 RepID=A0A1Y2K6A6_9PROT|nr:dual specificity protein phosphatase family protein [Magnetofaba australis]OSM04888.1 putative protein tyrosine phosphatase [Magnetofaba australis IT-1]
MKQRKTVELGWRALANGALAVGGRPKLKTMASFHQQGCTHVVTLLCAHEGADQIGAAVRKAGLRWLHLPLPNAQAPEPERNEDLIALFDAMCLAVRDGGRLYIHCSAGIHRTGMITYAFLLHAGLSPVAAQQMLVALRQVTGEGVGLERMAWAERNFPTAQGQTCAAKVMADLGGRVAEV